jgi:hypothetical protein
MSSENFRGHPGNDTVHMGIGASVAATSAAPISSVIQDVRLRLRDIINLLNP